MFQSLLSQRQQQEEEDEEEEEESLSNGKCSSSIYFRSSLRTHNPSTLAFKFITLSSPSTHPLLLNLSPMNGSPQR